MPAKRKDSEMPTFDGLMQPLVEALRQLGGSGSIEEIYAKTVELTGLGDDVLAQMHDPKKSSQTEVGYARAPRPLSLHLLGR